MSRRVRMLTSAVTGGRRSATRDPASGPGGGCHKPPSDHNSNRLGGGGMFVTEEAKWGGKRFVAQETQTRRHKKEATEAVSCREGSHKLSFHGCRSSPASSQRAGGRRVWVLFSRTAAEIDSLGLLTGPRFRPEPFEPPDRARRQLRIKLSSETRGNIRRRRGQSETTPRPQELHLRPRGSEVRLVGACRYGSYSPW